MRAGVIGLGSMGKNHVRNYFEIDDIDFIAVADIDKNRVDKMLNMYNGNEKKRIEGYTDYTELLNKNLDLVSIVTPTTTHANIAIDFCNNGVHCLVEKPISYDIISGKKVIDAAEKNNVKLMVGHIETFNPAVIKTKELIHSGILGNILFISAKRLGPFVSRITDVGIVIDSMTHDIGVICYLMNQTPKDIFCRLRGIRNKKGDFAFILMDFENFSSSIESNWFSPFQIRTIEITGTKSILKMDYQKQKVEIFNDEWHMVSMEQYKEPLRIELEHFIECVQNDKIPYVSGLDGLKILEIALIAEKGVL